MRAAERIDAERLLEPRDDDGEAQRIEPRVEQGQAVGQRGQLEALFLDAYQALKLRIFDEGCATSTGTIRCPR